MRYFGFFFPAGLVCSFGGIFLPAASPGSNVLPVKQLRVKYLSHHLHASPVWNVLVCVLWNGRRLMTVLRDLWGLWHSIFTENHPETAGTACAEPLAAQGPMTLITHLCVMFTTGVGGLAFKLVKRVLEGKKIKREPSCRCQITADEWANLQDFAIWEVYLIGHTKQREKKKHERESLH